MIKRKLDRVKYSQPFSSEFKYSVITIDYKRGQYNEEGEDDCVRVFVKGASEKIIKHCEYQFDEEGHIIELSEEQRERILNNTVINQFAKNRLRSIAFAYKDFTHDQWEDIRPDLLENKERKKSLFTELRLISIFAMEDELRSDVVQAIKLAKKGSIDVCIVSGDQHETVNAFAIQAGLIKDVDEHGDPRKSYESITAKEFRQQGGNFFAGTQNIQNLNNFVDTVRPKFHHGAKQETHPVKVISRAKPHDKLVLTKGLSDILGDEKRVVAVTGEGFADIDAIKAAKVGFAMGSGCPAAKKAAKMILINDDISSIINAVLWGRNIYCNIRRFLQFQITFNVTTVLIVFIGAIFRGATLFSVI